MCKPPIMLAPNYTLKDVIRLACSIASTKRYYTQHRGTLGWEKVHTWAGKHAGTCAAINILIKHTSHIYGKLAVNKCNGLLLLYGISVQFLQLQAELDANGQTQTERWIDLTRLNNDLYLIALVFSSLNASYVLVNVAQNTFKQYSRVSINLQSFSFE